MSKDIKTYFKELIKKNNLDRRKIQDVFKKDVLVFKKDVLEDQFDEFIDLMKIPVAKAPDPPPSKFNLVNKFIDESESDGLDSATRNVKRCRSENVHSRLFIQNNKLLPNQVFTYSQFNYDQDDEAFDKFLDFKPSDDAMGHMKKVERRIKKMKKRLITKPEDYRPL